VSDKNPTCLDAKRRERGRRKRIEGGKVARYGFDEAEDMIEFD